MRFARPSGILRMTARPMTCSSQSPATTDAGMMAADHMEESTVPVYDYKCPECHSLTAEFRKVDNRHDCPKCSSCGTITEKVISAPSMIMPDIQPYRAMAGDRRMVNSRVEHRQFLREFKLEEVGNEGPPPSVKDGRAYVPKRKRRKPAEQH